MVKILPDYHFSRVTKIDPRIFKGKKLILIDIDNTLYYDTTLRIEKDIKNWVLQLRKKHKVVLLSNSSHLKERRAPIEKELKCTVLKHTVMKPFTKLFRQVVRKYKVKPQEIVMIGDQYFTDILFANRHGAASVLVDPFGRDHHLKTRIGRIVSTPLVFLSRRRHS